MQLRILSVIILLAFVACDQVESIRPQRKNIVESVYASGNIIPKYEHNLFALINGTIIKKYVKDGDTVRKGQVLYEISNESQSARLNSARQLLEKSSADASGNSSILNDLRLNMENAQAKFKLDSIMLEKYKKLLASNATTQVEYDAKVLQYSTSENMFKSAMEKYHSAKTDLRVSLANAQSQVASAESDLNNFIIRSYMDGVVFKTYKEEGESVRMSELVALVGAQSERVLKLSVDQQDIDKIKTGQDVVLKTDITGSSIYKAKITRIYPLMNEMDQSFRVDAEFSEKVNLPFIHSSVEANIIIQTKSNALIVPRNALVSNDSLLVSEEGERKLIFVKTGILTLDDAEILSGADENTQIIMAEEK
ncbi:MAG: efflux RND transporter periplasmic adaptor subunit [Flavobacteriales bacterium]